MTRVGEFGVKLDGADLPARTYDDLIDVRVEQSMHLPDRVSLRLRDADFVHFDADRLSIGAAIDVSFMGAEAEAVVSHAEVTGVAVEPGAGGRHELVVTGLDKGHRLARGTEIQTYVNQRDSDVASQIAQRFGLRADVDTSPGQHDYLLQCTTAYEFLSTRASKIGFRWWVSDSTLHFKRQLPSATAGPLVWGANLQRFKARCSAVESAEDVVVRGWDSTRQETVNGRATLTNDLDAVGSDAPAARQVIASARRSGAFNGHRFAGASPIANPDEADALAKALALRAAGEHFQARGQALGDPRLHAGATVQIKGVGTRLAGGYLLTSVEHVIGVGIPYVTRFVAGGRRPHGLPELLGTTAPSVWGTQGVVIGVVTNIRDPEGYGRVKVKFPTLSDADESAWARVAAAGAGDARGFQIPFEVNDEVLVAFEHADLRRPVVLGGLWSGKYAAPRKGEAASDSQGNVRAVWQTKAGHAVELRDATASNDNHVLIALSDGKTSIRLGADKVTIATPNTLEILADQGVTITSKGDIKLDGANVAIKAKAKVAIEAAQIEAVANATFKAQGAQSEVKGSAALKLEGGGVTEVKGGVVKIN